MEDGVGLPSRDWGWPSGSHSFHFLLGTGVGRFLGVGSDLSSGVGVGFQFAFLLLPSCGSSWPSSPFRLGVGVALPPWSLGLALLVIPSWGRGWPSFLGRIWPSFLWFGLAASLVLAFQLAFLSLRSWG